MLHFSFSHLTPLVALCLGALSAATPRAAAQDGPAVRLLPHRATYALALDRSRPTGNLAAVEGKSQYTLEQTSCAWLRSVSSIALNFRATNGTRVTVTSSVDIHEQAGGAEMHFKTSRQHDGKQVQASEGTAQRVNGRVSFRLRVPETRDFDVPDDVQFPIQQLGAVLQAADRGLQQAGGRLYDGTETGLKLYRMTAQIGALGARRVPAQAPEQPSWPVAIGYYLDAAAPSNFPEHELAATLLKNGVYTDLRFIFRDFALTAR